MQNFLHRTMTDTQTFNDKEGGVLKATIMRTRTSAGFAAIALEVGNAKIELTSDLEDYESVARSLAAMLMSAANEGCALPQL